MDLRNVKDNSVLKYIIQVVEKLKSLDKQVFLRVL